MTRPQNVLTCLRIERVALETINATRRNVPLTRAVLPTRTLIPFITVLATNTRANLRRKNFM